MKKIRVTVLAVMAVLIIISGIYFGYEYCKNYNNEQLNIPVEDIKQDVSIRVKYDGVYKTLSDEEITQWYYESESKNENEEIYQYKNLVRVIVEITNNSDYVIDTPCVSFMKTDEFICNDAMLTEGGFDVDKGYTQKFYMYIFFQNGLK